MDKLTPEELASKYPLWALELAAVIKRGGKRREIFDEKRYDELVKKK